MGPDRRRLGSRGVRGGAGPRRTRRRWARAHLDDPPDRAVGHAAFGIGARRSRGGRGLASRARRRADCADGGAGVRLRAARPERRAPPARRPRLRPRRARVARPVRLQGLSVAPGPRRALSAHPRSRPRGSRRAVGRRRDAHSVERVHDDGRLPGGPVEGDVLRSVGELPGGVGRLLRDRGHSTPPGTRLHRPGRRLVGAGRDRGRLARAGGVPRRDQRPRTDAEARMGTAELADRGRRRTRADHRGRPRSPAADLRAHRHPGTALGARDGAGVRRSASARAGDRGGDPAGGPRPRDSRRSRCLPTMSLPPRARSSR